MDTEVGVAFYRGDIFYSTVSLSYQPGDTLVLETMESETTALSANHATLYKLKAKLVDVDVGYAMTLWPSLAIFAKGKLFDLVEIQGSTRDVLVRDGEIHALSYAPGTYTMMGGPRRRAGRSSRSAPTAPTERP